MLRILLLAFGLLAVTAQAAQKDADPPWAQARVESYAPPQQMSLVYDLYRNGSKLGQVTDTFSRNGSSYTLTSEMRASGPLKMLWPGTIRLESSGLITPQGLRPTQFRHARSDAPKKLAIARFDWTQRSIAWQYKGKSWQAHGLQDGTQDQLSQVYQFMFMPKLPENFSLQVVSGRDLNDYDYERSDGGVIETPLGALPARLYQRVRQKPDEKAIAVWIAPTKRNLPVRVRVFEEGVTLEQRLVRASIKD